MKIIRPFLVFIALFFSHCLYADYPYSDSTKNSNIAIVARLSSADYTDYVIIKYMSAEAIDKFNHQKTKKLKSDQGMVRFAISNDGPIQISIKSIFKSQRDRWIWLEPGDNIQISSNGTRLTYSGTGSEKIKLTYQIDSVLHTIPVPANPSDFSTNSLEDFFEWNDYLDKQLEVILPHIESYKTRLSIRAYKHIRANFIDQNIDDRSDKFRSLRWFAKQKGLTNKTICDIYDSIYFPRTAKWFDEVSQLIFGNFRPIENQIYRKHSFDFETEPLKNSIGRRLLIYEAGCNLYKGELRDQFIIDYLPEYIMEDLGFVSITEDLLSKYYAQEGFPEYKKYLRELEISYRERINAVAAPEFSLTGKNNTPFTKQDIKNKVALLYFWHNGCVACADAVPKLKKIQDRFGSDSNFVFVSVSADQDVNKWLKSSNQKTYTTGKGINLYMGPHGEENSIVKDYAVNAFPALVILDPMGRAVRTSPRLDITEEGSGRVIELIQKQLSYLADGPYILHDSQYSVAYSFNGQQLSKQKFDKSQSPVFSVQTDLNKPFNITLSKNLDGEPSEFDRPEKLLVMSDIEGNFDSFRKLLQANKVIDENFNWTFGKGHLVFAGDMFDRGQQVTECLWLIYSLEQKAKSVGGYVHFILGNHEVMYLYGDHEYTQPKYQLNARQIGLSLKDLYSPESELGAWLRTKNIIEKIGDLLFVHGGIAKEFADSVSLSLEETNKVARQHLGNEVKFWNHADKNVRFIHSYAYSPFWNRIYYNDGDKQLTLANDNSYLWKVKKPNESEMNAILDKWKVNHIITGHTIIYDTISIHYSGKVINIDSKHTTENSEALLIEGKNFFRVNSHGNKIRLAIHNKDLAKQEN